MSHKTTEVIGVDYTVSESEEIFHSPEDTVYTATKSGRLDGVRDSKLKGVRTDTESETLTYTTVNGSKYTVHEWTEDENKGILEDFNGNRWFYDSEAELSAYFNGEEYVAAHNPDIVNVWDELMDGDWMDALERDKAHVPDEKASPENGMNRIHPRDRDKVRSLF